MFSAIRLYAENRLSNKEEKTKNILYVLLCVLTVPDIFFVATIFLLLGYFALDWKLLELSKILFGVGIVLLILLHMVEWRRNYKRITKLENKCAVFLEYFRF
jgi:Flp pilus assembly protein TadB